MILQIDLGNSRLKWRLRADGASLACGAFGLEAGFNSICDVIGVFWPEISAIQVSSVQSVACNQALTAYLAEMTSVLPMFARTEQAFGQLINGYRDGSRLGVDRWLGMIAACQRYGCGYILLSAGTATTVDLVLASGEHLGGYIGPGYRMFMQSLGLATAGVRAEPDALLIRGPGRSTQGAVSSAYGAMIAGLLDQAVEEFRSRQQAFKLIFTGGDAQLLQKQFSSAIVYEDMVLDGLEVYFAKNGN